MLNIPQLIDEAKARKIKNYPQHINRASSIGHPCLRYLTYSRTHWEEKRLHDVGLQYVFDLGKLYEQAFLDDLREAGLTLEEQQVSYHDKRYQLSGHIDGKLPLNGHRYPIEIKSMAPYTWDNINGLEDLRKAKAHYVRGYEDQLMTYLFLHEEEKGYLFLVNKVNGQVKQIELSLDYGRMEEILKKCEAINANVQAGTLPERIEWDESVCGRCGFLTPCYPDKDYGPGLEAVDDTELLTMLEKREKLAEAAKAFSEVDAAIKSAIKGKNLLLADKWQITGKWCHRDGYEVKPSDYWLPRIKRLAQAT